MVLRLRRLERRASDFGEEGRGWNDRVIDALTSTEMVTPETLLKKRL